MREYFSTKNLIKNQIPEFVKTEHPLFVDFVVAYYDWLSQNEGIFVKSLQENSPQKFIDIDETLEVFFNSFIKTYLDGFPIKLILDEKNGKKLDVRKALKIIKKFYNSKGTEKSYRFLFRIIFDSEIELYYPKNDTIKLSDSRWNQKSFIRITYTEDSDVYELKDNYIYQKEKITDRFSPYVGKAKVLNVKKHNINNIKFFELQIENLEGYFEIDEYVYSDVETQAKKYGKVSPIVSSIKIDNPGENYKNGDVVIFSKDPLKNSYTLSPKAYVIKTFGFEDTLGKVREILIEDPGFNIREEEYQIEGIRVSRNNSSSSGGADANNDNLQQGSEGEEENNQDSISTSSISKNFSGTIQTSFLYKERGSYLDASQNLSSNKFIQDNNYYQDYSYEINSFVSFEKYKDMIKRTLHPAGMKLFGKTLLKKCIQGNQNSYLLEMKKVQIKIIDDYDDKTFLSFPTGITNSVSNPFFVKINPDQLEDFYGGNEAGSGQGLSGWSEWLYSSTNLNIPEEQIRFFNLIENSNKSKHAPLIYTSTTPFYKLSIDAFLNDYDCFYNCNNSNECL